MTLDQISVNPANAALEAAIRQHLDMVYAAALRQMGDPHAAADVTQAVFLILQRRMPTFSAAVHLPVWLLRTTRYACLAAKRRQQRRQFHETRVMTMRHEQESEAEAATDDAMLQQLDEALCSIPSRDQTLLVWAYFEGQSHEQIANRLSISTAATHKRVQRAIDKLRHVFAKLGVKTDGITGALVAAGTPGAAPLVVSQAVMTCISGNAPAAVSGLIKGTALMTKLVKAKIAALVAGAVLGAALIVTVALHHPEPQPPTSSAAAEGRISFSIPADQWSPVVKAVREEHSDALLKEVMAKLQESRGRLKTLHIKGATTTREYDPASKTWFDWGDVGHGEAWISLVGKERERVEIEYSVLNIEDHLKEPNTYVGLWDGETTRRLQLKDEFGTDIREMSLSNVRDILQEDAVTGSRASATLTRIDGQAANSEQFDAYELSPEWLASRTPHATRVALQDGRTVVQLELRRTNFPGMPTGAQKAYELYWFDEERGYALIGRREGRDGDKQPHHELIVEELLACGAGLFYPVKTREAWNLGEEVKETSEWKADLVEANQPIEEERFTLDLPPLKSINYSPLHYAGKPAATQAANGARVLIPQPPPTENVP